MNLLLAKEIVLRDTIYDIWAVIRRLYINKVVEELIYDSAYGPIVNIKIVNGKKICCCCSKIITGPRLATTYPQLSLIGDTLTNINDRVEYHYTCFHKTYGYIPRYNLEFDIVCDDDLLHHIRIIRQQRLRSRIRKYKEQTSWDSLDLGI